MNGDDSMAFGAAYMCANSSKNFLGTRKTFMVNGANERFKFYISNLENQTAPFVYCPEGKNDEDNLSPKKCVKKINKEKEIFPLRHKYNSKRSIELEHDTNLLIKITEEFPGKFEERDLKSFEITGVPEAIEQMRKDNITDTPKINIKFIYTKGGQIELESYIKYKYPTYFNEFFFYEKNYTPPLPKDEILYIDDILNKSIAISEYEMKRLIKNTTNVNKTETDDDDLDEEDDDYHSDEDYNETQFNETISKIMKH